MVLSRLVPAFLVIVSSAAACRAQVSFGPDTLTIDLSRTWVEGFGATLASESASSGPLSFGPVTGGAVTSPSITFLSASLPSPGLPNWMAYGEGRSVFEQSGNAQTMRMFANSVCITLADTPSVGQGTIAISVIHSVDFQVAQPTLWQGTLSTVLSSPMYPSLRVVRDPASVPITVIDETLPVDFNMVRNYSGTLAAGSYRMTMTFPLSVTVPGGFGGVHSSTAIFTVPAPSVAGVFGSGLFAAAIRRRRRPSGRMTIHA